MYIYITVLLVLCVNSISSYVITETEEPTIDYIDDQAEGSQYIIPNGYVNARKPGPDPAQHVEPSKTYLKKDIGKPNELEHKLSTNDRNKILKAAEKYHDNGAPGKFSSADVLGKFQSSIPYYVTKNDDIISAGDVGSLGSLGAVNSGGSLPSSLGSQKMNFSMGNYMKYLTRNSSVSTADMYKYVFSKKCSNNYNLVCLKLDLIKILSNINNDNNRSISIIPHLMSISINNNMTSPLTMTSTIPDQDSAADQSGDYASLQQLEDESNQDFIKNKHLYEQMVLKNNYNTNYYINNILKKKIIGLLNNMSLNIKLFDNTTIGVIKKLVYGYNGESQDGEVLSKAGDVGEKEVFDGRGRKRQKNMIMHAIASAAMMSGGTLLVLGLKTLAAMATKALIASLIALVLTCFSNFGGGGHKGDLKSTTYEIITKPIVSHGHLHTSEVQHAEPSSVGYNTYARSGPDPYTIDPLDVLPLQQAILTDKSNDKHIIHVNPMYAESREMQVS